MMRFISLAERKKRGYDRPRREEYVRVYEGEIENYSLEEVWEKYGRRVPEGFQGHVLSISDVVEFAAVVVVNKAVVQGCIYVGRRGGVGGLRGEDFAPDGAHVGQGAGGVGVLQGLLQVELAGAGLLGA